MSTVTRRQLLKGGAIVGGTIWVAPVIETFTTKAAAASGPASPPPPPPNCPPAAAYGLSGLTILYQRAGSTAIYWSFIGQGQTTCGPGSISNDDSFSTTCGANTLMVNTPSAGVLWNGQAPASPDPLGCPFTATAGGANVTQSNVTVLAWIAHNGTFTGGTPLGSKGHFEVQCGAAGQKCPPNPFAG